MAQSFCRFGWSEQLLAASSFQSFFICLKSLEDLASLYVSELLSLHLTPSDDQLLLEKLRSERIKRFHSEL